MADSVPGSLFKIWEKLGDELAFNEDRVGSQANNKLKEAGSRININSEYLFSLPFPVPSISIQQSEINRIESVHRLVDANGQLIALYEQKIKERIDKLWRS